MLYACFLLKLLSAGVTSMMQDFLGLVREEIARCASWVTPTEPARLDSLIECELMLRLALVRVVLPAVAGLPAGFLALGFAVGYGLELPSPLLYLIAPGMAVASHIFPHRPKSLAA